MNEELLSYRELGSTYRTLPCKEYPGVYKVYSGGNEVSFLTYDLAMNYLRYNGGTIVWEASPNDPRVGEVWFTSFYRMMKLEF